MKEFLVEQYLKKTNRYTSENLSSKFSENVFLTNKKRKRKILRNS